MARSSGDAAGKGRAAAIGGLPFLLAVCGDVLSILLTRAFLNWNEGSYPWRRIYTELAYFLLLPFAVGAIGRVRGSMITFLLVASGAALGAAIVAGEHYASPLGYDNADSLVVAVFIRTTVDVLGIGLLLPLIFVGFFRRHDRDEIVAEDAP